MKYENKSAVYMFKDENGNVVYVGSTNNLNKRMYNHKWCISKNSNPNSKLYEFLRDNNYTIDYLYTDDYRQKELEMIEKYRPAFNRVRVTQAKLDITVSAADDYAEYHRQYLQANKKYNAEHREYCKKWYQEHKDYFKKWYKEHKTK